MTRPSDRVARIDRPNNAAMFVRACDAGVLVAGSFASPDCRSRSSVGTGGGGGWGCAFSDNVNSSASVIFYVFESKKQIEDKEAETDISNGKMVSVLCNI